MAEETKVDKRSLGSHVLIALIGTVGTVVVAVITSLTTIATSDTKLSQLQKKASEIAKELPPIEYDFEIQELKAVVDKPQTKILGPKGDYVLWALAGNQNYRHGANAGLSSCEVYVEGGLWILKSVGGDVNPGSGGAIWTVCKAIGLKVKQRAGSAETK